jgi:integrase
MTVRFARAKISSRLVERLAPGETVADTDLPGYCVRRQQDARVYFVRKHANGRRHFVTIGEHGRNRWTEAKAREQALLIIAAVKQGRDPAAERQRSRGMPTLDEFACTFFEQRRHKLKPGTLAGYGSLLRSHISSRDAAGNLASGCLGAMKLDQVSRREVAALHRSLSGKPRTANHVLAFLSSLYAEARRAGLVEVGFTPTRDIQKFPLQARQRFLTEDELARVGEVLAQAESDGSEDRYALAAIRLLIFTGCRRNEILDARWDWVDLERGLLNLPDSKTGAKSVYLSPPAIEVLRGLPRVAGNPHIIVGAKQGRRWVNLRKVWVRVRQRAGLQPIAGRNGKIQEVRLHDLRHSFASLLASRGASLPMIGKLLGHAQPQTTARYAHLADDPLRQLNADVGDRVARAFRRAQRSQ